MAKPWVDKLEGDLDSLFNGLAPKIADLLEKHLPSRLGPVSERAAEATLEVAAASMLNGAWVIYFRRKE